MKVAFPGINHIFDCSKLSEVSSLVIKNPILLRNIIDDINAQMRGETGKIVVSSDDKPLVTEKYLELHSQFLAFSLNNRNLISKIVSKLNVIAIDSDNYIRSMELVGEIEQYCMNLSMGLVGNISFPKITVENIIKATGPEIEDDYASITERMIDYFELVTEYDRPKVFIMFNLRSFLTTEELQTFVNEVLKREYQIILLDSNEYPLLDKEKRVVIDESLCEIC